MPSTRALLRNLIFFLALAGLLVSGYVAVTDLMHGKLVCVGTSGCTTVNTSPYAHQWGIPVAVFGLVAYVTLTLLAARWSEQADNRAPWLANLTFGISLTGTIYSAYLTSLEIWVLKAYCTWCLISATLQLALLIVTSLLIRMENQAPAVSGRKQA